MSFKRLPLPLLNDPSPEEFEEFLNKNQPVLIQNSVHWKLLKEFSLDKITELFGDREYITTTEDLNKSPTAKPQKQSSMLTINKFIQRALQPDKFSKLHVDNEIMYLSTGIPEALKQELEPILNFLKNRKTSPSFSMSTKGSISNTDSDNHEKLLVQIAGTKKIILFNGALDLFQTDDDQETDDGYLIFSDEQSTNGLSNPESVTEKSFPGISALAGYECILKPGDILYIPFKWWHYARTLDFNISINLSFQIIDYVDFELLTELSKKIPKAYRDVLFKDL